MCTTVKYILPSTKEAQKTLFCLQIIQMQNIHINNDQINIVLITAATITKMTGIHSGFLVLFFLTFSKVLCHLSSGNRVSDKLFMG